MLFLTLSMSILSCFQQISICPKLPYFTILSHHSLINICLTLYIYSLQFAKDLSVTKFEGISKDKKTISEMQELYALTMIYAYFHRICASKISLDNSAKRSFFLSDHALTGNTKTKQVIQTYIDNIDPSTSRSISKSFPSHRREAIDYFRKQYDIHVNILSEKMDKIMNESTTIIDNDLDERGDEENESIQEESDTQMTIDSDDRFQEFARAQQIIDQILNGKGFHEIPGNKPITVKYQLLDTIFNAINELQQQHLQSQQQIDILRERVYELEDNQHRILNDIDSYKNNNDNYTNGHIDMVCLCSMMFFTYILDSCIFILTRLISNLFLD